ncbi:MAG: hypothetical protein ACYSUX_00390 [Planctomycetota bacterium]|jgi:hypothetical protein
MEENEATKAGLERYHELQREAKSLGLPTSGSLEQLEKIIAQAKAAPATKGDGITAEEAKRIEASLKYEHEFREKLRAERQVQVDRAAIITEAKSLNIPITLPEKPTELELAKARLSLGMKKKEVKPSPETIAIESSKKGYYMFTNREQEDAAHTVNPGGKYTIHLIPDQIHVLSEAHIKLFRKHAVVPVYGRVPVPGPPTEGQLQERCERTGSKPRFAFEYFGEAPKDAPFGMVTDMEVLEELKQPT